MEQIVIEVNSKSKLNLLIDLFSNMKGVTIKSISGKKIGSVDKSLLEVSQGKIIKAGSASELIEKCLEYCIKF
jgi:hypothetical protein